MEDIETFKHIDQWTPGNQVLPSLPSEEKIGNVQKHFGTTVKQKLQADQSTFAKECDVDKQKKALQTKVLPGDGGENLNLDDLPPGLLSVTLDLREDYPLEDIDLGIKKDIQKKRNHQSETFQKTFYENFAKFKTFESVVDNAFEGVKLYDDNSKEISVRKEESNHSCGNNPGNEGSNDVSVLEMSRKLPIDTEPTFNDKGNASFEDSAPFPEDSASLHKGSVSFQKGSASLHKSSVSFQKGSASLHKGKASFHKSRASSHKVSVSFHKGSASFHKGSVSFHKGSASLHKGTSVLLHKGSASFPDCRDSPDNVSIGKLQGPTKLTATEILENHFASKGKRFYPLSLHGNSGYTGISSTISLSELTQAAQYHGCATEILLLSKSDPPDTNEPHTQSDSSQIGDTFGQWKIAEPDGLGKLAKQGHRFIGTTVSQQLSFDSRDLSNVKMAYTHQLGKALSQIPVTFSQNRVSQSHFGDSVSGLAYWTIPGIRNDLPMANQNICKQLSPDISAQPVPPDITQYTCSEELKHALQMKFFPFKDRGQAGPNNQINGGATSDHRYHPYSRPEATSTTQFQTSLPNLPEFIEKNSKKK